MLSPRASGGSLAMPTLFWTSNPGNYARISLLEEKAAKYTTHHIPLWYEYFELQANKKQLSQGQVFFHSSYLPKDKFSKRKPIV